MWDLQTKSIWSPFDGVALDGPPRGIVLPRIPCYQTTWREWLALHPDTEVVTWQPWATHRDARHGHGTMKWLGSSGVGERFMVTIESGGLDIRLPENELTLGVQINGKSRTYPLSELRRANNVANDEYNGESVVVFAASDSHTMGGFLRKLNDQVLDFTRAGGLYRDTQSGSTWNIEGLAIDGPLKGAQLTPIDFYFTEWHSWAAYHGDAEIYSFDGESSFQVDDADLSRLIDALRKAGFTVNPESNYTYTLLPLCAQKGFTAAVDGGRLTFFVFHDVCDAEDYAAIEQRCSQAGLAVVKADPYDKDVFLDAGFDTRRDNSEIPWSPLVDDAAFLAIV